MLRIHVNDNAALADLRQALMDADRSIAQVAEDTLLVTDPLEDETEARIELAFFLRAWQAKRPDAEVELLA